MNEPQQMCFVVTWIEDATERKKHNSFVELAKNGTRTDSFVMRDKPYLFICWLYCFKITP